VRLEAGFERNLNDGIVALLQVARGALQAQPPNVLL